VVVGEAREGYEAGETVAVQLLRPRTEIDRGLVAIGSHDLSVDVLADLLGERYPGFSLSSANVGSLGGLQALARREAHLAGTHLLDEATGEYNTSYVARMLPGQRVALICLANRQQGLIVAKGNPLGLTGVADLLRPSVRFINRQRGAGTRVLLDYELRRQGLAADAIEGYRREVYTHLAVAAEVAGGGADAGMGILAAAQALGLDFVPVASERYELALPADVFAGSAFEQLLALIRSDEFATRVSRLGGYDTAPTGEVRWVEPAVEE
jgi:putative molybdopterin biosynthesis protein